MRRTGKRLTIAVISITMLWALLTVWVQTGREKKITSIGQGNLKVLIVYHPDPIYTFDEQISTALAESLAEDTLDVTVATVASAYALHQDDYDLIVFCANTYNWRPDKPISRFIKKGSLFRKPVVAITLGAGATTESKAHLELMILRHGATLLFSETYWLWRPNDEARMEENNVEVALDQVRSLGKRISTKLKDLPSLK